MSQINNIQLSILIPSIPSRFEKAIKLYTALLEMIGNRRVEVIMLTDNKVITIGEKHNYLLACARGKYFCFLHDDDELVSIKEIYHATFRDVDVIDFKAECRNTDGSTYIVRQQLGNEVEHNTKDGRYLNCKRPPFPNCAWRTDKFAHYQFPNINYGEDWVFIEQCLTIAKTEYYINKVLFKYNFDENITEASTETNEYWTNPNESNN